MNKRFLRTDEVISYLVQKHGAKDRKEAREMLERGVREGHLTPEGGLTAEQREIYKVWDLDS